MLNSPCAEAWKLMKTLKHQWFETRKTQPKTYFWYGKMLQSIFMPDWLAIANGPGFDDISACLGFGWPSGSGTPGMIRGSDCVGKQNSLLEWWASEALQTLAFQQKMDSSEMPFINPFKITCHFSTDSKISGTFGPGMCCQLLIG